MADSSCSLSFPSEPPDIRNWFSSYEYESPGLDLSVDFKCFSSEEIEGENEENSNLGIFENPKEKDVMGFDDLEQEEHPVNKDHQLIEITEIPLFSRRITEDEMLQGVSLRKCDSILSKDHGNSSTCHKISLEELNGECVGKCNIVYSKSTENSATNQAKSLECLPKRNDCERKLLERTNLIKEDNASPKRETNSKAKLFSRSNVHEGGNYIAKDGFISTKNHKIEKETPQKKLISKRNHESLLAGKHSMANEENNWSEKEGNLRDICVGKASLVLQECDTNLVCEGQAQVRRIALLERTNFLDEEKLEIAGKWQCPRKNKPNIGPPLKQLRLERWVHRVT
ncbi:ATP-dependent caseinolytic protease/crotonase family protein [Tasmannia lanceolata]|uniref:ATP-dependent caseinolytic protease/crotonase family protein n=1 Tax=Tasmannia lanceolata TaxID=3420 RepID=UPI004064BF38